MARQVSSIIWNSAFQPLERRFALLFNENSIRTANTSVAEQ